MLIETNNITLEINNNSILKDISLSFDKGEIVGLIGPNGAGKTSLLKILANIQPEYHGSYLYEGNAINSYSAKELAKSFGYLAQDATAHWPLKVQKLIELGRLPFQGMVSNLNQEDIQAVEFAAKQTEVEHLLDRVVTSLSGGERTRVFLARLFAAKPQVIFVDEPIAALDPYHQLQIMEILQNHARNGGTVIIVLHDLNLATRFCDRLVLLDKGQVAGAGSINELLKDNLLEDIYNINLKMFCDGDAFAITPWARTNE